MLVIMLVAAVAASRTVFRTARVGVRATPAQRRRLLGMLARGGDVWAALIELNRERARRGGPPLVNYQALCRELAGAEMGELGTVAARSVLRRYSDARFETARRRAQGEAARYPRRRRRLFPLRWYHGRFTLDGRRVRLPTARGCPPVWLRLSRELPYPAEQVRSVTLLFDAGQLWLDVTAAVRSSSTTWTPTGSPGRPRHHPPVRRRHRRRHRGTADLRPRGPGRIAAAPR